MFFLPPFILIVSLWLLSGRFSGTNSLHIFYTALSLSLSLSHTALHLAQHYKLFIALVLLIFIQSITSLPAHNVYRSHIKHTADRIPNNLKCAHPIESERKRLILLIYGTYRFTHAYHHHHHHHSGASFHNGFHRTEEKICKIKHY